MFGYKNLGLFRLNILLFLISVGQKLIEIPLLDVNSLFCSINVIFMGWNDAVNNQL